LQEVFLVWCLLRRVLQALFLNMLSMLESCNDDSDVDVSVLL
jgi:hypothetical protein